ncbi:hypothetical protein Tco_0953035 [Tanacetum coccineum]|uniref:Uncharacterized protein n=1 Tax=Tanacetum coccineum TaxID=301880 RepID=A0ABQ5DZ04_9ASTR
MPDTANISDSEDTATTYQAPTENSLLEKTGDIQTFMNWYYQKIGKTKLTQADFEDKIDWTNPEGDQVRIDINRPLPLSGPPGYAARYHDFGHELLIPEHMQINDVCTYDISASYGISHWWFNRQKFYIDRHTADSSRKVVRIHMRILSVVSVKSYFRYGYDYLKEITLRRADYQEYMIAEKDFKNLYPSDFEDLNLLLFQGHLNHLPGLDKRWDATGFEYKHDYTIIESPRVVVFPVNNNEWKIMRFNEIYKFGDGTLTNILEALDYKVKEYKRTGKYGDSDGYTFDDPILILEILSRRFLLRGIYLITGSSKDGDGDTSFQWSQFTTQCSHLMFPSKDIMTTE